MSKALNILMGRRALAALILMLCISATYSKSPARVTKFGRFGAQPEMAGVPTWTTELSVVEKHPKAIMSSFVSMSPNSLIQEILLGVVNVTGNVTAAPVLYDHEGHFLRSGRSRQLNPTHGLTWVSLPLHRPVKTADGKSGRDQVIFLGVILECGQSQTYASGQVTLALVHDEVYSTSKSVTPRIATHLVVSAPGGQVTFVDYNKWERAKHFVKKQPDGVYADDSGFIGIQASWSLERPSWKAFLVAGATIYAVILMTDGVPAFFAFSGLVVFFVMTEIITVQQAVAGFAQEGILTVAVFLVIARALDDISYVEETIMWIMGMPKSLRQAHLQMMLPVALMSAIVPNTAIISMMIPILNRWAMRLGIAPAQLMMPMSFASLLGSNLTLLGSAANLIAAAFFTSIEIRMFDLTRQGICIVIVGIAYMTIAAPWLLKSQESLAAMPKQQDSPLRRHNLRRGDVVAAQEQTPQVSLEDGKTLAWEVPVAYKLGMSGAPGCIGRPTIEVISSSSNLQALQSLLLSQDDDDLPPPTPSGGSNAVTLAKARLYAVRFRVDPLGPLCGTDLLSTGLQRVEGVNLVEVLGSRGESLYPKGTGQNDDEGLALVGGEVLRLRVTSAGYHNLRGFRGLQAAPGTTAWLRRLGQGRRKRTLVEAVVQSTSSPLFGAGGVLDGETILLELAAVVVGVRRGAVAAGSEVRLNEADPVLQGVDSWYSVAIAPGDVLLLDARDMGQRIEGRNEFLLVRTVHGTNPPRAGGRGDVARACLGLSLLLGLLVVTSLPGLNVSPLAGAWVVAALYLIFDLLSFEQVLQTLNARLPALLTLMTAMGVGEACRESGIVDVLSRVLIRTATWASHLLGSPAYGISFAIFLVVCNFAAFVNMGAAVACMAPVIQQLLVDMPGVQLKPMALVLMFAANSPFATPFGATANLMVVGAGNYTFMDFFRFGAPLQLIVMVTAVLMS